MLRPDGTGRRRQVANHLNEWAGGTGDVDDAVPLGAPDWSRLPTSDETRAWVAAYLRTEEAEAIDAFSRDVELFLVVDHFYWGLWGLNQSCTEGDAEFPYLKYGTARLRRGFETA